MLYTAASSSGDPATPSEDWFSVTPDLIVVLDGATVRTDTGCEHGLPWYVRQLGVALVDFTTEQQGLSAVLPSTLIEALAAAIQQVAWQHYKSCDLSHPGTPSAAVGIIRNRNGVQERLLLGDITVVTETDTDLWAVSDSRVSRTAAELRAEADLHPLGSPEKSAAIQAMKPHELAARNRPGGYYIAAADSSAAQEALYSEVPLEDIRRFAVLSDGAARYVDLFGLSSWREALAFLELCGPEKFIEMVRLAEQGDPLGIQYPRNKGGDDATAVFVRARTPQRAPLLPYDQRMGIAAPLLDQLNDPDLMGEARRLTKA
jgi:hypothetical protein